MTDPIRARTPRLDDWSEALCRDVGRLFKDADWFPERENSVAGKKAIKVCRHCPVAAACLDQALKGETNEQQRVGIFGGMTADDRRAAFGPLATQAQIDAAWAGTRDPERGERWLAEIEKGVSYRELARRNGFTDVVIHRAVKKARKIRDAA